MNNCDNKDGGSSSEIQHTLSTTPTTITTVSSSTTTSEQTTATNSTTTTSVVDNQETFYTSNENLINNSTTAAAEQEEHETECADNTNKIGETTPVAAVVSDTNNTEVTAATTTIPTVSYAAITAMDTATATAFMSSCYTANKFEIENSFASVSVSVAPNCDTNSSTSTETTTTTFSDNELITKQPSTTPTPRAPSVTTSEIVVAVAATPISGEIGKDVALVRSVGVVDEELLTSNTKSPIPSMIEKLENKENVSLENESIRMDNSNCGDIACKSLKSPMLLRKKIHTLTTTSSEPILNQCGSGNSSGYTAESPSCSGLTTTNASSGMISRRVSFPKSDDALVTGYLEPANPWEHVYMTNSISEIAELYIQSCQKHNTTPIQSVLDHLKAIEFNSAVRQPNLSLKSLKLLPADCEALEEIFKRVQYKAIDISSCDLNETAASALFDMFEYYEATNELDISSNADGMTSRGWTSCIYLVSHSRALQMLNAQGNPLSKNCADNLGSALNSSNLHTLKLEHCGLKGHPIDSLCIKLRNNKILRELWLAHNDLTCQDADKIGQLLRTNHYLQLIDISNNNIKDEGVTKIVKALIEQSTELARQQAAAAAQRLEWRAAFAEAEYKKRQQSLNSSTNGVKNGTTATNGTGTSTDDDTTSGDSDASPAEEEEEDDEDDDADDADVDTDANDAEDDDGTTTDNGGVSKAEDDDDDEDTVKTTTLKTAPAINGQSKLDKLLSMNNSDSSEDVPTDTVAASDISISDDIFDSTSRVAVITSTPIVDSAIEQQERPAPQNNINNNETAAVTTIFEASDMVAETAAEGATIVTPTKALDVNKNATIKLDDFDDTHSTDSAFESSSDGDISRHLPEEFASRFDGKDDVETATIATEALTTPTPTPPPVLEISPQPEPPPPPPPPPQLMTTPKPIDVSCSLLATSASPNTSCDSSSGAMSALKNAALTGTSPSPASGMRRTESTCTITQSTRLRSHSSDSLSSDNSLDGSLGDANSGNFSTKINEKLTKNDTLTRQKQFDVPQDSNKTPHGLKALALWNNNLTKESGPLIADLLATTVSLELLNIGKNILCNDFVAAIRDSLSQNTTLTTLGLQSAHLSCAGIRTLSSILQFGGNNTLQRIDIRDNKIEVESLNMLAEALKSNTCVTQIDIDDEPKRLSIGSDAQLDYARVLENVRSLCSRNENQPAASATTDKAATVPAAKRRVGYYLGSRKISLTCHTAPPRAIIDQANGSNSNTTPTSSKLEVKKKTGVRLRSPIPSPPTISPSSSPVPSPSKSRFQVFRVSEVSPLTSPMSPSPSLSPSPSPTPLCTAKDVTGVLINSKDSTTTIKRLSTSPRSRFQVMKIYEDPGVPIAHRTLPPITPSPSPPTAPSITTPPLTRSSPSRAFEEPKIVTTPATPPIAEEEEGVKGPSFPAGTPTTNAATTTTTTTTTDTKTNPNPLIVNNSTNTVKPNDQVDAATASSPPVPQDKVEKEEIVPQLAPTVEEDQRTLTNSSVNSCLINSIAVTTCSSAQELTITQSTASSATQELQESEDPHEPQDQEQELQPQPAAARARKVSWIQNSTYPGTVDRLLSIFQNSVFQRSSSPETTQLTSKSEAGAPPSEADQQSLVPVRKRSPPSATQLPAWCKLGTEICKPVTTVIQTAAAVSSGYTASGTTTAVVASSAVEGPLSFFDAASKQLRDFSKQVFRQNIAFANEATNNSTLNQELPLQLHHDCDTIPSDVKLEIKENISPEHTINEEQLQTLQKIGGSPGSSSPSSSGTDTTEGASSTSSSPSSLLNAPLIGPSMASEVLAGVAEATAQSPHLTTEEQFCTS